MIRDYVCLDLETTGLEPKYHKILEIGAVKVQDFQVVDSFQMLIHPAVDISERITQITGITEEMVQGQPYIEEILPEFIDFCGDYVMIGHNLMFDYSFLKKNAVNCGLNLGSRGIDTLKIARKHLAHLEKRSLEYLCACYGLKDTRYHRAYNDAMATHELYCRLCESDFFSEEDEVFQPRELIYKVKREVPATDRQIIYLNDLIKYHKINIGVDVSKLTKNEASRYIDKIISQYGRIGANFSGY